MHQLSVVEAFEHILMIGFLIPLGIWLLYVASGRGIVVSHGKAYHRAVGEGDWSLHESLAKRAPSHHQSAVPVLDSSRGNLGS